MAVRVGVPKETTPGERRVALVPDVAARLIQLGAEVLVEKGAGAAARYPDEAYEGCRLVGSAQALLGEADVILKVQPPSLEEIEAMREGAVVIGFMAPHRDPERVARLRDRRITAFAMELVPRISRAQSMDALSSQASVAGYKAALLAASLTGRFFPMLTTAAGTLPPVKLLVLGAGVAGLQAIATARRLGAAVSAYDIRPEVAEQIESLGAKFVAAPVDESAAAATGYAKEVSDETQRRQQAALAPVVADSDVVITTAQIPGAPAPLLVSREMVEGMKPGSVIVDVAAPTGGNCELTRPGETVVEAGVTILGPLNIPSTVPYHASQMYSKNITTFLLHLVTEGELRLDLEDEITAGTMVTRGGRIVHPRVLEAMGQTVERRPPQ